MSGKSSAYICLIALLCLWAFFLTQGQLGLDRTSRAFGIKGESLFLPLALSGYEQFTSTERRGILGDAWKLIGRPLEPEFQEDATVRIGMEFTLGSPLTRAFGFIDMNCRAFAQGIVCVKPDGQWGVVEWLSLIHI